MIQNDTVKRGYDKDVPRVIQLYRGRNYLLSSQCLEIKQGIGLVSNIHQSF